MKDILITRDPGKGEYRFYEPTTDTLLISADLWKGFSLLNTFLTGQAMIVGDILEATDLRYHIDSETFRGMVESNAKLIRQLDKSPSQFKTSQDRFGTTQSAFGGGPGDFGRTKFGSTGFNKASKKWNKRN